MNDKEFEESQAFMEREANHAIIIVVLFRATVIGGWLAGLL